MVTTQCGQSLQPRDIGAVAWRKYQAEHISTRRDGIKTRLAERVASVNNWLLRAGLKDSKTMNGPICVWERRVSERRTRFDQRFSFVLWSREARDECLLTAQIDVLRLCATRTRKRPHATVQWDEGVDETRRQSRHSQTCLLAECDKSWSVQDQEARDSRGQRIGKVLQVKGSNCSCKFCEHVVNNILVYCDQEECLPEVVHSTAGRLGMPTGVTAV